MDRMRKMESITRLTDFETTFIMPVMEMMTIITTTNEVRSDCRCRAIVMRHAGERLLLQHHLLDPSGQSLLALSDLSRCRLKTLVRETNPVVEAY